MKGALTLNWFSLDDSYGIPFHPDARTIHKAAQRTSLSHLYHHRYYVLWHLTSFLLRSEDCFLTTRTTRPQITPLAPSFDTQSRRPPWPCLSLLRLDLGELWRLFNTSAIISLQRPASRRHPAMPSIFSSRKDRRALKAGPGAQSLPLTRTTSGANRSIASSRPKSGGFRKVNGYRQEVGEFGTRNSGQ